MISQRKITNLKDVHYIKEYQMGKYNIVVRPKEYA